MAEATRPARHQRAARARLRRATSRPTPPTTGAPGGRAAQYDFTSEHAITIAAASSSAFSDAVAPVDTAFSRRRTPAGRTDPAPDAVCRTSPTTANATLVQALKPARWAPSGPRPRASSTPPSGRSSATRRSPTTRDSSRRPDGRRPPEAERMLAAELISPLLVPELARTAAHLTQQANATRPPRRSRRSSGHPSRARSSSAAARRSPPRDIEKIDALGLGDRTPDLASFAGWLLLVGPARRACCSPGCWRFRPDLWHRNNVLVLLGLLVVGATLALKLTAGRPRCRSSCPTAAIAILLAILLDAATATIVIAIVAIIGGAVNGGSLEFATYVFLGGLAGHRRRPPRRSAAGRSSRRRSPCFVVNAVVVTVFSLLGDARPAAASSSCGSRRRRRRPARRWRRSGSFAVARHPCSGSSPSFQLLELANPSQPLLRRLLVETPGTYHHSLMVGNLAERAAEAIGADPLITRVAAYYHDVGKLANPLAFIENQAGGDNIHDELDPERQRPDPQAARRRRHRPRLQVAAAEGAHRVHPAAPRDGDHELLLRPGEGAGAGPGVDRRRADAFRHVGPKPQSREAALLMLADSVEASVRSLVVARRAGHPGDGRRGSSRSASTTASSTSATSPCATSSASARRSSASSSACTTRGSPTRRTRSSSSSRAARVRRGRRWRGRRAERRS